MASELTYNVCGHGEPLSDFMSISKPGLPVNKSTVAFNINDTVRVRLTDRGRKIHRANYDAMKAQSGGRLSFRYRKPKEDRAGWSEWQLWELMLEFGSHCYMGPPPPFETTIEIPLT